MNEIERIDRNTEKLSSKLDFLIDYYVSGKQIENPYTATMEEDCLGGYHCTKCFNNKYWIGRERLKGYENYCPCCGARFTAE